MQKPHRKNTRRNLARWGGPAQSLDHSGLRALTKAAAFAEPLLQRLGYPSFGIASIGGGDADHDTLPAWRRPRRPGPMLEDPDADSAAR